MKKVSLFLALLFATALLFAQDSTGVSIPVSGGAIDWITTHLGTVISIVLGVYELAVRLIPTLGNYSLISYIVKLLNILVPNRKAIEGSDTVVKHID